MQLSKPKRKVLGLIPVHQKSRHSLNADVVEAGVAIEAVAVFTRPVVVAMILPSGEAIGDGEDHGAVVAFCD